MDTRRIGSLAVSLKRADEFVAYARQCGSVPVLARALRYASYPYRATGAWVHALALTREALDDAVQYQLAEDAAQAGDACATTCIELGDLQMAQHFLEIAESWSDRIAVRYSRRSLDLVRAALCVRSGRPDDALLALSSDAVTAAPPNIRERLYILDVRCRALAALHDTDGLAVSVQQLTDALSISRGSVRQDSYVEALVIAMEALGHEEEARLYARTYATQWRRDTSPLPHSLAS